MISTIPTTLTRSHNTDVQRQRNALPLLHEVHIQQRVLLRYASVSSPTHTSLIRVSISVAPLQVELVVDALVVEQVLHHLRLSRRLRLPPHSA